MTSPPWLTRPVPALAQKPVFRLGLAPNYGIDDAGVRAAFERGINYVFWTPTMRKVTPAMRDRLKQDRESVVVASGPTFGFFRFNIQSGIERILKRLDTDYLDVFQIFWEGTTSRLSPAVLEAMLKLKDEGKVRHLGISIHDRERAGQLAEDSALDLLMIRYNAAHPGAERDIFPHLARRQPAVVAYTATRWGKLLRRPRGWEGPVPTAADCYRFCLSNPHVDVTLCGPKSLVQLDENLAGLQRGPMDADELRWIRDFGKVVHG